VKGHELLLLLAACTLLVCILLATQRHGSRAESTRTALKAGQYRELSKQSQGDAEPPLSR
jgi:hypothetical protein